MAKIECSVPEELLAKRVTPYDGADAYGYDIEYFIAVASEDEPDEPNMVSVAKYQGRNQKTNRFQEGKTDPGFDVNDASKVVTYPVQDSAREFVSIIEAHDRITGELTNRGAHTELKFGALAEMIQGTI